METILEFMKAFLLLALFSSIALFAIAYSNPNPEIIPGPSVYSTAEFEAMHQYHGVQWSYRVGNDWYFLRDGKRCRLFLGEK